MFWSKQYSLLVLVLISSFAQIILAHDVEENNEPNVQVDAKTEEVPENQAIETDQNAPEDILGQSLMTILSQNLGQLGQGGVSPISTIGAVFPALNSFLSSSWPGLNPLILPPNLNLNNLNMLGQPNMAQGLDQLPAASKVMLVLADEQQGKFKRSPILNGDLLRQIRQNQPQPLFNMGFFQGLPNSEQLLQQIQQTSDMLGQSLQQVPAGILGQSLTPQQSDVAQESTVDGADAGSNLGQAPLGQNELLGVILNQFNNFGQPLMKILTPQAASSDISEVRMLPENNQEMPANEKISDVTLNTRLLETLNDKKRPILWFRSSNLGNKMSDGPISAFANKNAEEEILEKKLIDFERQVIKELKMLQEIDREAREMRAAAKETTAKVNSEPGKLRYSLSEMPLHKITREDVEKVLSDEYVLKMLQKKFSHDTMKEHQKLVSPIKRQAQNPYVPFWDINSAMSDPNMVNMMAYALRSSAPGTKDEIVDPIVGDKKFDNQGVMEFSSPSNTQSIDNMQRQWMEQQQQQPHQQIMNDQQHWIDEKINFQQGIEQARRAQEFQGTAVENEKDPRHSSYKKWGHGYKKHYGVHVPYFLPHYGFGHGNYYGAQSSYGSSPHSYGHQGYSTSNYGSYGSHSNYGHQSTYDHKTKSYGLQSYREPTYHARAAVGNDEIDAMLQNDKTLMVGDELQKINLPQRQITQGEWQRTQETDFKNNHDNSKAHSDKRLANKLRFWISKGEGIYRPKRKTIRKSKRSKRNAEYGSMAVIDEKTLNELRATYKGTLKEIILDENEDPSQALIRLNAESLQEAIMQAHQEPMQVVNTDDDVAETPHVIAENYYENSQISPYVEQAAAYLPEQHEVLGNTGTLQGLEQSYSTKAGIGFTGEETAALFDANNLTESSFVLVLEEIERRLNDCCVQCKNNIMSDILNNNKTWRREPKNTNQDYEQWLNSMSAKGYNLTFLTMNHYEAYMNETGAGVADQDTNSNQEEADNVPKVEFKIEKTPEVEELANKISKDCDENIECSYADKTKYRRHSTRTKFDDISSIKSVNLTMSDNSSSNSTGNDKINKKVIYLLYNLKDLKGNSTLFNDLPGDALLVPVTFSEKNNTLGNLIKFKPKRHRRRKSKLTTAKPAISQETKSTEAANV